MHRLAVALAFATACSHAAPRAARPTPRASAGAAAAAAPGALPKGPELDRELMGFVIVSGGAELARELLPDALPRSRARSISRARPASRC